MSKYKFLMAAITRRGLVGRDNLFVPAPANASWLKLAHCSSYVDQVVNSTVPYRIEREIGFPVDERVSRRARLAVSGTVLAARLALDRGIACNAAGGSHHARHDQGAGFCTFNDVAVAANVLLADGSVDRIAVIDLDVHQGDGTAQIFSGDDRVYSFSMHAERNYPVRKAKSDLDIALPDGTNDEGYLSALEYALPEVLKSGKPDIVFYNAGVDPHCEDRLGRLALTDDGLRRRDRAVVGFFRSRGIPVCGVIGGGYSMDIEALAARHAILFETVAELMST